MLMSSFSFQQDIIQQVYQSRSDSLTIMVDGKLQPSTLIISDERDMQTLATLLQTNTNSNEGIVTSLTNIHGDMSGWMSADLERRSESSMDYLERKSGWSSERIDTAINTETKKDRTSIYGSGLTAIISVLLLLGRKTWKSPTQCIGAIMAAVICIVATYFIIQVTGQTDYSYLDNLLKLSG